MVNECQVIFASGPVADLVRALTLGAIGCAGLAYVTNLAMISRRRTDLEKRGVPLGRAPADRRLYLCRGLGHRLGLERVLRRRDRGNRGRGPARYRDTQ